MRERVSGINDLQVDLNVIFPCDVLKIVICFNKKINLPYKK